MSRVAIVTGSRGFVGTHLTEHLLKEGWQVEGFNLRDGQDIRNYEFVRNAFDVIRPDAIFHLAAQAYVPESLSNPNRTFEVNTIGSLNILEAVRQLGIKTTVHLAGTSEEYGNGQPYESARLQPRSPYAISKAAMDHLGQMYAKAYGLHVIITRAFNHTGPGRGEMYAESSWAKQVAEIEQGKREFVEHGNLETMRNYSDVRDIVRAYVMAVDIPSGVYNICSNQNVTVGQVLEMLTDQSPDDIKTKVNHALYRAGDFSFKIPDCSKFQIATGWKPEFELHTTLKDLLDYWRSK